jgi:hypothetical protein
MVANILRRAAAPAGWLAEGVHSFLPFPFFLLLDDAGNHRTFHPSRPCEQSSGWRLLSPTHASHRLPPGFQYRPNQTASDQPIGLCQSSGKAVPGMVFRFARPLFKGGRGVLVIDWLSIRSSNGRGVRCFCWAFLGLASAAFSEASFRFLRMRRLSSKIVSATGLK